MNGISDHVECLLEESALAESEGEKTDHQQNTQTVVQERTIFGSEPKVIVQKVKDQKVKISGYFFHLSLTPSSHYSCVLLTSTLLDIFSESQHLGSS